MQLWKLWSLLSCCQQKTQEYNSIIQSESEGMKPGEANDVNPRGQEKAGVLPQQWGRKKESNSSSSAFFIQILNRLDHVHPLCVGQPALLPTESDANLIQEHSHRHTQK